jgi:hypothetical protein
LPKARGGYRLVEAPKARLKAIQRKVLHEILAALPPHEAAHGFRRGRSILSYASPHCGQVMVLRMDLRDFFPSVHYGRVYRLFRSVGYPVEVARLLGGLCTHITPADVLESMPAPAPYSPPPTPPVRLRERHLPQGAPTSPALANLCAYHLDCRLAALAQSLGARYTRYADDLAFSGSAELARAARRFHVQVATIALEEGFEVNTRKTRFMRRALRQQLSGVVVNDRPNVQRDAYDRLKAILHNCVKLGPASQNLGGVSDFRAHLTGRVAHVAHVSPARGQKLAAWLDRIVWPDISGDG